MVDIGYSCWHHCRECFCLVLLFFFFEQKTAYEMRISDGSSDVCSSDLRGGAAVLLRLGDDVECERRLARAFGAVDLDHAAARQTADAQSDVEPEAAGREDRKSVVSGKSVAVRVDFGGRRIIKKKLNTK